MWIAPEGERTVVAGSGVTEIGRQLLSVFLTTLPPMAIHAGVRRSVLLC